MVRLSKEEKRRILETLETNVYYQTIGTTYWLQDPSYEDSSSMESQSCHGSGWIMDYITSGNAIQTKGTTNVTGRE